MKALLKISIILIALFCMFSCDGEGSKMRNKVTDHELGGKRISISCDFPLKWIDSV